MPITTQGTTTMKNIHLHPDLCWHMICALHSANWDAAERGDMGTEERWDADGKTFDDAIESAINSIDGDAGAIDGKALAAALERMSIAERAWGDDPQTAQVRAVIIKLLGWDVRGRDLLIMLASGDE